MEQYARQSLLALSVATKQSDSVCEGEVDPLFSI